MSRRTRILAVAGVVPILALVSCSSSGGSGTPNSSGAGGAQTSSTASGGSTSSFQPGSAGTLTIATEIGNPGWVNGKSPTDLTGGVEYEMGLTFAKDFGLKPTFRNVSFTPLVSGAVSGYDIGLMTIFKTAAREKVNDYSDCYYTDPTGAFVRKGVKLTSLADAKKLKWGYVTGGYAGLIMQKLDPDSTPKSFQDGPTEYAALQSGAIDAVMDDLSSIAGRAQTSQFTGSGAHVAAVFDIKGETPPCSAAQLPKNSPAANVQAVNAAIRKMKSSGQIQRWVKQYLSPLVSKKYPTITVG